MGEGSAPCSVLDISRCADDNETPMATKEGAMRRPTAPDVHAYVSDRVFDGTRALSPARVAKLRGKKTASVKAKPRKHGLYAMLMGLFVTGITILRHGSAA